MSGNGASTVPQTIRKLLRPTLAGHRKEPRESSVEEAAQAVGMHAASRTDLTCWRRTSREHSDSDLQYSCKFGFFAYLCRRNGVLAQLVERLNGIQKVRSSILLCSTETRVTKNLVTLVDVTTEVVYVFSVAGIYCNLAINTDSITSGYHYSSRIGAAP